LKHAHFTLDVTDGIGAEGFSLETPLWENHQGHLKQLIWKKWY
jgi:hypothetical protein